MFFVFQEANLLPWARTQQNVELPLKIRGLDKYRRREKARRMFELVGLSHAIAFLIGFFPVVANTTMGFLSTDRNFIDSFKVCNASTDQEILMLRVPYSIPHFLTEIKNSRNARADRCERRGHFCRFVVGWRRGDRVHEDRLQLAVEDTGVVRNRLHRVPDGICLRRVRQAATLVTAAQLARFHGEEGQVIL